MLNILSSVLTVLVKFITYPIVAFVKIFLVARSKMPLALKFLMETWIAIKLCVWSMIIFTLYILWGILEVLFLGGTVVSIVGSGIIDVSSLPSISTSDNSSSDSSDSSSSSTSSLSSYTSVNSSSLGYYYDLDISTVSANTAVSMPSGSYQAGTALQRAEILLIVQEICARDEITITPEQLVGVWYSETTAEIPFDGSVLTNVWEDEGTAHEGPFQHGKGGWAGTGDNRGRAFISSLEDPNLSDDQRVQTSDTCTLTIAGQKRPSLYCFSDAAYTTAYRLSLGLKGSAAGSYYSITDEIAAWGESLGFSDEKIENLKFINSLGYYSSHNNSFKTFIPALYMDIYDTYGSISQWYNLASARGNLNTQIRSIMNTMPRNTSDFKTGSGYTNYATYAEALVYGNWESIQFPFMVYNGGKYVYNGLAETAVALGATKVTTSSGVTVSGVDGAMTQAQFDTFYAAAQKYYGVPYEMDPNVDGKTSIDCSAFVSFVLRDSGYDPSFIRTNAQSIYKHCVNVISVDKIQPGDLLFYTKTYPSSNPVTHVAIYIGNGMCAEAGNPCGEYTARLAENEYFYAVGRLKNLSSWVVE